MDSKQKNRDQGQNHLYKQKQTKKKRKNYWLTVLETPNKDDAALYLCYTKTETSK